MITGVVEKVLTKPWNNKVFYSLALVNEGIYNFGTKKPAANVGDKVAFEAQKNNRGYWDADFNTLKVTPAEPESVSNGLSVAVVKSNGAGHVTKDTYWLDKAQRDIKNDELRALGAARNTAIEWVKFLVGQEALPVPKTVAAREDAFRKILDDYTRIFMSGIEGLSEEVTVTEPAKKPGRPKKQETAEVAPATPPQEDLPWE
jgi:hypothetical protein